VGGYRPVARHSEFDLKRHRKRASRPRTGYANRISATDYSACSMG
jgi:hypothetical protein